MPSGLLPPPLSELNPEDMLLGLLELAAPNGFIQLGDILDPTKPANPYDFSALKYPDDIEHFFMHGHYMNFFINVPVWSQYYDDKTETFAYLQDETTAKTYDKTDVDYFGEPIAHTGTNIGKDINYIRTQRISQAISIYIPDSVSFMSGIQYEDTSAASELGSIVDKFGSALGSVLGLHLPTKFVNAAGNFLSAAQKVGGLAGFAANENALVLFRKMNLREFHYDFFFSPKSEREAQSVRNIIRAFRFHAHPETKFGYGLMYIAPGTFDITFMHRGEENKNIHKVSTCVLTNVEVDYAPYGWSTHIDGMPIQSRLSLTFKETEVMTKDLIEKGY